MKSVKKIIFYATLILNILQHNSIFTAEEKAIAVVTTSAQTVLGKTVGGLAAVGPYVSVALQAYHISEEIRKHNFPTLEERAYAEEVAEKFALLTAENELQNCLVNNRSSAERNCFGRPVACEDIANMLNMLGGSDEVKRMTSTYNQYRM